MPSHYGWQGQQPDSQPVILVGKGITFDTGGINLKLRLVLPI